MKVTSPGPSRYVASTNRLQRTVRCVGLLAGASYFALLVWAVKTGSGLGGPLALPGMLLAGIVMGAVLSVVMLCPLFVATELVCVKRFGWQVRTQLPVATALALAYLVGAAIIFALVSGLTVARAAMVGGCLWLGSLIPLVTYWWSLQSADRLFDLCINWKEHVFPGP